MKTKRNLICTIALFLLFLIFTAGVKFIDVAAIGPENSEVGFATLNKSALKLGESPFWYAFTEYLGYFALAVAGVFGLIALYQLFKRKSLKKVDPSLLSLMIAYVFMMGFYVLFEIVVINYRPVLEAGQLAASYPSSHTFLVCTIMLSALMQIEYFTEDKLWRGLATAGGYAVILLMVVGRMLSGVHWLSDIAGGVLLSAALVMLYRTLADFLTEKIK